MVSLFPLGIGPEPDLLRKLAPGVLWVAALLATMLSLPRLFADDHRDGTLEQLALSPYPLGLVVTGSSDDHGGLTGRRLGCCTTEPDAYAALAAQASGAEPYVG